jgi:hypothetical protein
MMNKSGITILVIALLTAIFFIACTETPEKDKLAGYVTKEKNGLSRKLRADSNDVVCQLIPENEKDSSGTNHVYRFMVSVYSKPEKSTDSVMYFFNYHAAEYFRLVNGSDTILPVLGERMANGRRDIHQFTVVFDLEKKLQQADSVSLLFNGNRLFTDSLVFRYAVNDILKASKSLYGYE